MGVNKSSKTGKKEHKNKSTSKKYTKYKIEGDKVTREKFCPRCGPGIFLSQSQNRVYCGKCHFTEFEGKPAEQEKTPTSPKQSEDSSAKEKKEEEKKE